VCQFAPDLSVNKNELIVGELSFVHSLLYQASEHVFACISRQFVELNLFIREAPIVLITRVDPGYSARDGVQLFAGDSDRGRFFVAQL